MDTKEKYLEILCFRQFYKHFVLVEDEDGNWKKRIEKYFEVRQWLMCGGRDTNNSYFYKDFCTEMSLNYEKDMDIIKSIDFLRRINYKPMPEYMLRELINESI